ncbi:MAG: protein-tyrosine phosphatase family protein [Simkaniaceae bacterium]|nr:protein-tyrosine phosphatase family protein [Candidatus Sacchlamyda saccharinae]
MTALATASLSDREFLALQDHGNNEVRRASFSKALDDANISHNQYVDILPFDGNIPRFNLDGVENYYNASLIGNGLAIAAQGPGSVSLRRFYAMVSQLGVSTIVSLSDPEASKIHNYWSRGTLEEENKLDIYKLERRTVWIGENEITHYHLTGWKIGESIPVEVLVAIIKKVGKVAGPLLVHCSSGTGRTGTFLASYEAYIDQNPDFFSIAKRNRSYDKGRMSMIQTPVQYQLGHDACAKLVST